MRVPNLLIAALTIGIAAPLHSQDHTADGALSFQVSSPGRHMGESILLAVTNTGHSPLAFTLPPGWVFESVDGGTQNLLLVRAVELVVPPGGTVTTTCEAYCVEPDKKGPKTGASYRIGHMGGATTTELARFIDSHRFRDQAAILFAVWAALGERPVSTIQSDHPGETELLQAKVRELLGIPDQLLSEAY